MGRNSERPRQAQCTPSHGAPPDAWARSHTAAAIGGVPAADNVPQGPVLPQSIAREQLLDRAAWERRARRRHWSARVGPHCARAVPGSSSRDNAPLPHGRRPDRSYIVASRSTSSPAQKNMAGFPRFGVDRIDSRRVRSMPARSVIGMILPPSRKPHLTPTPSGQRIRQHEKSKRLANTNGTISTRRSSDRSFDFPYR